MRRPADAPPAWRGHARRSPLGEAARAIRGAQRPVILAGNGIRLSKGEDALRSLAESADIPVATTSAGKGVFAETAGGVTVGVTAKLIADGVLDPDAETVVINSGDGLKTLDAVSGRVGPKTTIPPRYDAFTDFWKELDR